MDRAAVGLLDGDPAERAVADGGGSAAAHGSSTAGSSVQDSSVLPPRSTYSTSSPPSSDHDRARLAAGPVRGSGLLRARRPRQRRPVGLGRVAPPRAPPSPGRGPTRGVAGDADAGIAVASLARCPGRPARPRRPRRPRRSPHRPGQRAHPVHRPGQRELRRAESLHEVAAAALAGLLHRPQHRVHRGEPARHPLGGDRAPGQRRRAVRAGSARARAPASWPRRRCRVRATWRRAAGQPDPVGQQRPAAGHGRRAGPGRHRRTPGAHLAVAPASGGPGLNTPPDAARDVPKLAGVVPGPFQCRRGPAPRWRARLVLDGSSAASAGPRYRAARAAGRACRWSAARPTPGPRSPRRARRRRAGGPRRAAPRPGR